MPASVVYCQHCNSYYSTAVLSEKEIARYYQNFTFNPPPAGSYKRARLRRDFAKKCRKIKKRIGVTGLDFLDFGGGCGLYSQGFEAAGFEVTMVEVDLRAIEIARALGIKAMSLEDVNGEFDVVFSSHVIEHYQDLDLFFSRVKTLSRPSGLAVVACPNKDSREFYRFEHVRGYLGVVKASGLFDFISNPWWCLDPPRHFYSLSRQSLTFLAEKHGFAVVETFSEFSTRSNFCHNDMYALCRLGNLLNPLKLLYKIYVNLSSLLMSMIFKNSMYGDNLVVVLKKLPVGTYKPDH